MRSKILNVILINLQLFCISILTLFFIGLALMRASHDVNKGKFLIIYFLFVIAHLIINDFFIFKIKKNQVFYFIANNIMIITVYIILLTKFYL